MDVPVKPVWPKEPIGYKSPRFPENGESISQPKPRKIGCSAGVCADVNFRMVSGLKTRVPSNCPTPKIICANLAKPAAVVESPACPAPPPINGEVCAGTTPRKGRLLPSRSYGGP